MTLFSKHTIIGEFNEPSFLYSVHDLPSKLLVAYLALKGGKGPVLKGNTTATMDLKPQTLRYFDVKIIISTAVSRGGLFGIHEKSCC
jgi:hypothetical protein